MHYSQPSDRYYIFSLLKDKDFDSFNKSRIYILIYFSLYEIYSILFQSYFIYPFKFKHFNIFFFSKTLFVYLKFLPFPYTVNIHIFHSIYIFFIYSIIIYLGILILIVRVYIFYNFIYNFIFIINLDFKNLSLGTFKGFKFF